MKTRLVCGIHACNEVLKVRPQSIKTIWIEKDKKNENTQKFISWGEEKKISIEFKSKQFLSGFCQTHQGIFLSVTEKPELNWSQLNSGQVLLLDNLEDPHNLGAILRSAWLLGVKAIFIPERKAVSLTPSVAKVAQGGSEHVPIEEMPLKKVIQKLKDMGFWVYGLSETSQKELWSCHFQNEKVAWVLGSESKGIRPLLKKSCDQLLKIPQMDSQASFNVSVAASIAMFETFRQQTR